MNRLRQDAADYLMIRRALGFKLRGHDQLLKDFLANLEQTGKETITTEGALAWATAPAGLSTVRWSQRLCAVRGFARHLHGLDPSVEVPPVDLLTCRRERPTPYLYTQHDIIRLVEAASGLRPTLRAATHETFFGLLASTGLRVGEAIHLDRGDVDLDAGVLDINDAKFRKHRRLPLHQSTVAVLRGYTEVRDELCPRPKAPSFFVSLRGTRLLDVSVHAVFRQLVQPLCLAAQPGAGGPRIHDLRHTFAVATLRDWYRCGADMPGKLPVLSAYLGHAEPASTYWYLQACPELLGLAAQRLERLAGDPR
jgi:integrase/recombinase XerD